jgi:hypothetical protein
MNSFAYRIYHDESGPFGGSLSIDPERHEELKSYGYADMEGALRLYYLGQLGTPPYSGEEVNVFCGEISLKDGVSVTLVTDISEEEAYRTLCQFTESLKNVSEGRRPLSLCLSVKKLVN